MSARRAAHRASTTCRSTSRRRAGRMRVVDDVTYDIRHGEFVVDHRAVGLRQDDDDEHGRRLRAADDGRVLLDGKPITGPGPDRGVIFQEYGVFPWLTVRQNIAFGLKLRANRAAAAERDADLRALHAADGPGRVRRRLAEACCRAACASAWRSRAPTRCSRSSC